MEKMTAKKNVRRVRFRRRKYKDSEEEKKEKKMNYEKVSKLKSVTEDVQDIYNEEEHQT